MRAGGSRLQRGVRSKLETTDPQLAEIPEKLARLVWRTVVLRSKRAAAAQRRITMGYKLSLAAGFLDSAVCRINDKSRDGVKARSLTCKLLENVGAW